MDTNIVQEVQSGLNTVLERIIQSQTGLPPGATDPILQKLEGLVREGIEHFSRHEALPENAAVAAAAANVPPVTEPPPPVDAPAPAPAAETP